MNPQTRTLSSSPMVRANSLSMAVLGGPYSNASPRVLPDAANSLRHRAAAPQGFSIWHNARSPSLRRGATEAGVVDPKGDCAVLDLDTAPQTAPGVRALHDQTGGRI